MRLPPCFIDLDYVFANGTVFFLLFSPADAARIAFLNEAARWMDNLESRSLENSLLQGGLR